MNDLPPLTPEEAYRHLEELRTDSIRVARDTHYTRVGYLAKLRAEALGLFLADWGKLVEARAEKTDGA